MKQRKRRSQGFTLAERKEVTHEYIRLLEKKVKLNA